MEFKVGDIVMIKGTITKERPDSNYPIFFESDSGKIQLYLTRDGRYSYTDNKPPDLELIERPKKKVVKYKVLYRNSINDYRVTDGYYSSKEEFEKSFQLKFMQLLESTAKEFEE